MCHLLRSKCKGVHIAEWLILKSNLEEKLALLVLVGVWLQAHAYICCFVISERLNLIMILSLAWEQCPILKEDERELHF